MLFKAFCSQNTHFKLPTKTILKLIKGEIYFKMKQIGNVFKL